MATAIGAYATAAALKALIGISGSEHDTLLGLICDRVNQYIETKTKQVIAPITSAAYVYDGDGLTRVFLPTPVSASTLSIGGLRAVTLFEIAPTTGGTFETIASTDYFLRGKHGMGGPYRYAALSDIPAGSFSRFPEGRANVRITGTAGWAAIPDDLTQLAIALAQRAWNARQAGYQNVEGVDEQGKPIIARFLSLPDYKTLRRYTVMQPQVMG